VHAQSPSAGIKTGPIDGRFAKNPGICPLRNRFGKTALPLTSSHGSEIHVWRYLAQSLPLAWNFLLGSRYRYRFQPGWVHSIITGGGPWPLQQEHEGKAKPSRSPSLIWNAKARMSSFR
jgi:hypothetical protein